MSVFATIAFAAFLLENDNLLAFYKGSEDFTYNLCAFHCGSANFNCFVGLSEEHAVKFDLVSFFNSFAEIVNIQELFRLCLKLLSLDFYDSVHLLFCCVTGYTAGRTDVGQIPFHCLTCPVRLNRLQN